MARGADRGYARDVAEGKGYAPRGWLGFAASLAVAISLLLAPGAYAGTGYVTDSGGERVLHYDAAPGETNDLSAYRNYATIALRDNGRMAAVTAGDGCSISPSPVDRTLDCAADVVRVDVALGDEDDRASPRIDIPVNVAGGDGNDRLDGNTGGGLTEGDAGDDIFTADTAPGPNVYSGGDGRDTIVYSNRFQPQQISLDGIANDGSSGEGDNVGTDIEIVFGGRADDVLVGSDGADKLNGGEGNDSLDGLGGADDLDAWYGTDDHVTGGPGNDAISTHGATTVDAGTGNDVIRPIDFGGQDAFSGGPGVDRIDYSQTAFIGTLRVSLDDVANDGGAFEADNVHSDIENVTGSDGDDVLIGSDGANTLAGGYGDDILDGGGGSDTLEGGAGEDVADYSSRTAGVDVDLDGAAGDDGEPGEQDTVGSDVEDLWGGAGDDKLTGNAAENVLVGGLGADQLRGGAGEDVADYSDRTASVSVTIDGTANDGAAGEGDDVASDVEDLIGGSGDDFLSGGAADNTIDGGPGADDIRGGPGVDAVDYSRRIGAVSVNLATDATDDGASGEGDSVHTDVEGAYGGSGDDTLTGGTGDGFLVGADGDDRLIDSGGSDLLDAGSGSDSINSRDGATDTDSCGPGEDAVVSDPDDDTGTECEVVDTGQSAPRPIRPPRPTRSSTVPTRTSGVLGVGPVPRGTLRIARTRRISSVTKHGIYLYVSSSLPCVVHLRVDARGHTLKLIRHRGVAHPTALATATAKIGFRRHRIVRLRLTKLGRRVLRGLTHGDFRATAELVDGGRRSVVRRRFSLRP